MASYGEIMKKLRESVPQGSDDPESAYKTMPYIEGVTPVGTKQNMPYTPGQEGPDNYQLLKSDSSAGVDVDEDTDAEEPMGDLDIAPDEDSAAQTDHFMGELKKQGDTFKAAQAARKVTTAKKPKVETTPVSDEAKRDALKDALMDDGDSEEEAQRKLDLFSKVGPTGKVEQVGVDDEGKPIYKMKGAIESLVSGLNGEEGGEDTDSPEIDSLTINDQGLQVNDAVIADHGKDFKEEDTEGETDIFDILDQYEKDMRGDMSDEDREEAAGADFDRDLDEGDEIYSGDGPGGKGEVFFFDNPDGGSPRGYIVFDDGSAQVVTGMLFPPGYKQKSTE